jgi:acyl-ACP thioesterase
MTQEPGTIGRHSVRSFDADSNGRLKLGALFQYYQEAAGNDARRLGVGFEEVHRLGYFWVLSRVLLRVRRLPAWGDDITLATWPKGHEGLSFLRDFRLSDAQGRELVAATSAWLLLDRARGRPHSADVLPVSLPPRGSRHALDESMQKPKPLPMPFAAYDRKVMVSDLDINAHVNNARYVEWALDAYAPSFLSSHTVRAFQIHYTGEALFGDIVSVSVGTENSGVGRHSVDAEKQGGKGKVFQAMIEWEGEPQ